MAQDEPKVGHFYNCKEQSEMHGGSTQPTLPDSDGRVTLIRFRRDKNPNGPHVIEHGPGRSGPSSRVPERVEMLRRTEGDCVGQRSSEAVFKLLAATPAPRAG